jgi:hypothetical protein
MQNRRFTRLTNAFSKKVENLEHAVALTMMQYNYCRVHYSLRVTPGDGFWSDGSRVGDRWINLLDS